MNNYLNKTQIKERGFWTDAAIRNFLGYADKEAPNPKYKKAASMKFYLEARVKQVEGLEEFQNFIQKSKVRKEGAEKALRTKIKNMQSYGSDFEIIIPHFESMEELYIRAIEHYNTYMKSRVEDKNLRIEEWNSRNSRNDPFWVNEEEYEFAPINLDSEKNRLDRATVNYLRHRLTSYEKHLLNHNRNNKGKFAKDKAYKAIKDRINNAIADKYPELGDAVRKINDETERQLQQKEFYRNWNS